MVFSLSEMAVVHPTAGSFGLYAESYLNPLAGFVVRYTYWLAQVIAVGGEAVAAGVYMTFWYPTVPVWMWSLSFAFLLLYVNSRSVGNFGLVEYWFAFIKVAAIILFIILGTSTIFGIGQPAFGAARAGGASLREAALACFLAILAEVPDSLIGRKCGRETALVVSREAAAILRETRRGSTARAEVLAAFDVSLRNESNSLNPGTTADLTAASIFVHLLEQGPNGPE